MSGEDAEDNFLMSSGNKSVGQDLDNLDINNLGEMDLNGIHHQQSDLLVSEIRDDNLNSSKKDAEDDMEEMENMLKSGGAFGGKDLGNSLNKMRGQIHHHENFAENEHSES